MPKCEGSRDPTICSSSHSKSSSRFHLSHVLYIWHVLYSDRENYTHHECRHVEEVQFETKGVGSLLLICYWRSWECVCVCVCVYQLKKVLVLPDE
jgi:hypothetical protein